MLIALVFRGVAFEFRFKATQESRKYWDAAFHFGSLAAAFMQGVILGSIIQGIEVQGRSFSGGHWDWLTAFPLMTGIAVVSGYALLGATWLILKTTDETQKWARKSCLYVIIYVLFFVGLVSIWVPFTHEHIFHRWFDWPNIILLAPMPIGVAILGLFLVKWLKEGKELAPFLAAQGLFALNYIGLGISMWPWMVPYSLTVWDTAAAPESLSLLLVGTVILLPVILGYTAYSYYVFRGKTTEATYH